MNFSRTGKENRELQGFCKEEKKKRNLGISKGSEYRLLSTPQKEHPAAWAKEPSHPLPAHQEPSSQTRVAPPMVPHHVPLLSVSSLFFPEWVPPLQGWKSLPCELSHRSAMQPSLQLCCHRHDSGRPAPVTPHTSQMIVGFFDLRNFLCYVLPEGGSSSFSLPGLGNAGVPAMVLLSPKWHCCI